MILEALATGLSAIATAVGGNVELVEEGVNRTLVKAGDDEDVAQPLLGYLHEPDRIAKAGRQARLHAEQRFSIPAMAEAYSTVYEQTLRKNN